MLRFGFTRRGAPISIVALAALVVMAHLPLRAQSLSAAPGGPPSAVTTPRASDAQKAYAEGLRAEAEGNWETAFQAYGQAATLSPSDQTIRARAEFARLTLAQERTEEAEKQVLSGNFTLARAILQSATELDPTNSVAQERLQQIEQEQASAMPPQGSLGEGLAASLPTINPGAGTRDFNFEGPTRGAYEEVARQFGVTPTFDPELQDRQIRFRVSGVDFDTAMRLLGEETNTFWFGVDSKTFFVAADTLNKRRDYDPEIKKTILLPASETNDEMTEAMRMVRDIVGLRRTELDFKTHSITVRDPLLRFCVKTTPKGPEFPA